MPGTDDFEKVCVLRVLLRKGYLCPVESLCLAAGYGLHLIACDT